MAWHGQSLTTRCPLTARIGTTSNTSSILLVESEPVPVLHLDHPLQQGDI